MSKKLLNYLTKEILLTQGKITIVDENDVDHINRRWRNEVKHTPLPWQIHSDHNPTLVIGNIDGPDDGRYHFAKIADCDTEADEALADSAEQKANAVFIVRACNNHYALLASCRAMMKYMEDGFLVRNIKDDAKSDWAFKSLSFVKDMKAMHDAIAASSDSKGGS